MDVAMVGLHVSFLLRRNQQSPWGRREEGGGGGKTLLLSNLNSNPLNKDSGLSSWCPLAVCLVKASLSFLCLWRGRWQLVTTQ